MKVFKFWMHYFLADFLSLLDGKIPQLSFLFIDGLEGQQSIFT
jgi:hypothetical protein